MNDKSAAVSDNQEKLSACLTAVELVSLRKGSNNNEEFPYVIGQKSYTRNDSWLEEKAVECALENQNEFLNQKIASRISDLIDAEWNADLNVAVTSKLKGKYVQHMGRVVDKKIYLSPEESVFLLQNRSIEILHKKTPMSLEEAYAVILKKSLSFEKYQVYSHLAQLGFIVVPHQPKLHSIRKENLSRRKQKRKANTSLGEEPKEKRSTANESNNISELYLAQDSNTVSNDSHNLQNNETLVEVSESNESISVNDNSEHKTMSSLTLQFRCDKEIPSVNNFQDSTCVSDAISSSEKPGDVSNTVITDHYNDNAQNKMDSEPKDSMSENSVSADKYETVKEHETLVSFKSCSSIEGSPPLENKDENVPNAVVENTISNDCTILTAANTLDTGEGRSDLPLNAHFTPLISGKDNSMNVSDISNDLESIKKKYIPEQELHNNHVVEIHDKNREEESSDQDSIEVEHNSESDRECDVMSCSSEEDENSVDICGRLPGTLSIEEKDDDITLVEVKKKETTPLAIIDILSDEEQTEAMSMGAISDNDDEVQIVKVCSGSSKSSAAVRNSYQNLNSIKREQKHNIKGTHHKFLPSRSRIIFPDLFRKDVVCLARPQPNLLPNNVKPTKEAYVLDLKNQSSQSEKPSRRLWNSYRDLQDYQHSRRFNRNTDSCNWRFSRPDSRQFYEHGSAPFRGKRNDSGHIFQNNFHEPQSHPEMMPPASGREFPRNHEHNNFNLGPMNTIPGMTGNMMADLHRAAYSFANSMLANMMNQSMMNNVPQYASFHSSRYRGNYSNLESNHSSTQSSVLSYESYLNNIKPSGPIEYGPGSSRQSAFRPVFNPLMNSAPNYPVGRDSPQNFNRNFFQRNPNHRGKPFPCVYSNIHNKKSWNEVKAVVESHNGDMNDHNSDIEEVPIDVNEVLWNSELHPLIKPGTDYLVEDVLKSLQKTKVGCLFNQSNERFLPSPNQILQITFDVYLPGSNFKKTCPDIPKYRIVVVRATDPIPKISEIVVLQKKWNDGAILQLAVVDNGDISFYAFNSVQLPCLIPHEM